jgi:hypothetical protein
MTIGLDLAKDKPVVPKTWDRRIARWISYITNPAILATLTPILIAIALEEPAAWLWAGLAISIIVVIPMGYLIWLLKKGKVGDFEVYNRRQRYSLYVFTASLLGGFILAMWIWGAPYLMLLIAGIMLLQGVLMFLVNLFWKISAHSAGITNFSIILIFLFGVTAAPIFVLVPLVAWARIRLRRHTLTQTLAGIGLSFVTLGIILIIVKNG